MLECNPLQKPLPYYQQIQQSIKESIFNGIYKPGDRLYEAQIATFYNTSRSPVREAIRALVMEGLLVMDQKSQISVYKPNLQDVRDIYECRISLESTAVELTAVRATEEQLQELEKTLEDSEQAMKEVITDRVIACNARFHELIIQYSGNPRLMKLVEGLNGLIQYYRVLNIQGENRFNTILKGHREIYDAIKERNPKKAADRLREHTQEDLSNLVHVIEQLEER
ncbi:MULTISPECIES: GntR family transcriptional regulator [Neobacillus]|uniref:GntR family transcriptional regulator n=1 Tax=Neobacillus rhizophilus TaxID=2833579 RepID=A0A942U720_9BACI|nr:MULTISPECIES: GntR family transcriptional regulator [Neobacillus]MBS4214565.1 GntR family transcriptional regulator [Neobacillus rhizophilus]MBU8918469.1 GntR family transcriptional regulator [Bacillus sp. FJAT-29953]